MQGESRYITHGDDGGTQISSADSSGAALCINHPIATLLLCEGKLFLAIGDVIRLKAHSKRVEHVSISLLSERQAVHVTYQLLRLVPEESAGSLDPRWRVSGLVSGLTRTVAGPLVLPINPDLTNVPGSAPAFVFKHDQLLTLAMMLNEHIALSYASRSDAPKIAPDPQYPYQNELGTSLPLPH